MKTYFTCLFITMAAANLAFPNLASAATDPTSQLAAIYAKTDAAFDHKDIDSCLAYHSPNFMAIDSSGIVETTDQQRIKLAQLFSTVGPLDVATHIDKCDYADKTATVIITQHIKTTITSPETGKATVVSGDILARELWIKDSAGWEMDVIQTLRPAQLTPDNGQ